MNTTRPKPGAGGHHPHDGSLNRRLRLVVRRWQGLVLHPRFQRIKERASGMMHAHVYHELYKAVRALPPGDVIEIGGGAGAGSIVAAQARRDAGADGRVITVEKCEGGSRDDFGGYDDNLSLLSANLRAFGVSDRVTIYPHHLTEDSAGEVKALLRGRPLAGLICDADGRIDRDFQHFVPLMIDDGLIVVDDAVRVPDDHPGLRRNPASLVKFQVTVRLLEMMERWGVFRPMRKVGGTVFGRRPRGADAARIDRAACQREVERLYERLGLVAGRPAGPGRVTA